MSPSASEGPLTVSGTQADQPTVAVEAGADPDAKLVASNVSLDPSTSLYLELDDDDNTPDAAGNPQGFSQLAAVNVNLGGAMLFLDQGWADPIGDCITLSPGDSFPVITASGTLSGDLTYVDDSGNLDTLAPGQTSQPIPVSLPERLLGRHSRHPRPRDADLQGADDHRERRLGLSRLLDVDDERNGWRNVQRREARPRRQPARPPHRSKPHWARSATRRMPGRSGSSPSRACSRCASPPRRRASSASPGRQRSVTRCTGKHKKRRTVTVATGSGHARGKGAIDVTVHLTAAGRALLKQKPHRLAITDTDRFKPTGDELDDADAALQPLRPERLNERGAVWAQPTPPHFQPVRRSYAATGARPRASSGVTYGTPATSATAS